MRRLRDRLAVGLDALVAATDRLQHVAQARPYFGLVGILVQQAFAHLDRLFVLQQTYKYRGPQLAPIRIAGIILQQPLALSKRFL